MDFVILTFAIALSLVIICVLLILFYIKKGFENITKQIKTSILPHSLSLSSSTQNMVELAVDLWRLEKRILKTSSKLSDDENKALYNSVEKIRRFIQKNDIEIIDYAGRLYNEGMNIDILSSEKDPGLKQSIIYETHEPAVTHKGILIRKAKVIIHEK